MTGARSRLAAIAALVLAAAAPARAAPPDEAGIRDVEARQEAAWNAHDAHAYAALLSEDANLVTVRGWWWKSRAEAERKLAAAFAYLFAPSALHMDDMIVRPLGDDLALAHVAWSLTGVRGANGAPGRTSEHLVETQVLRRGADGWRIVSLQQTDAVPERPYPTRAVPGAAVVAPPADAAEPAPARPCLVGRRDGKCLVYKRPARNPK